LIIVESPAKIRTIREIVGRRFDIKASIGHIRDIPSDNLGVDVENDFRMTFVTIKGKSRAISEIKSAAQRADRVYIATDPDREGEAIAWHVCQLVPTTTSVERITFNAITRSEIEQALQHPSEINQKLVDSQFARRIIDRLIGYLLSPESSRHLGEKYSVGRVQSPALALIVEREREIRAFQPEPYWLIKVAYAKDGTEFAAALKKGRLEDGDEAAATVEAIRTAQRHEVVNVESGEVKKNPPPPFITSTFQRAAFKAYRMNSNRAMRLAQDLYEGQEVAGRQIALITYMRTDSPRLSAEGMEAAREQVVAQFGQQYHQRRNFRSRAGSQDAHEAIRPAHPEITPDMAKQYLDKAHLRIYSLIYKRWLASQMKPALYNRIKVQINADQVELETVGTTLTFEGFLRVYGKDLNEQEKDDDNAEGKLPELAAGDTPDFISADSEKKMTQPPPRYNNGSLVEKLESLGIGRPSTYAQIVQLIQTREYVEEGSRREFVPTARGEKLFDYLKEHRPIVIDYAFTAQMEGELDDVEEGKKSYLDVVNDEFEKVKDAYELYRKGSGFAMEHKPTRKQLNLAKRLAEVAEEEIPAETLTDSKKLSDWIDSIKSRVDLPTLPPTDKQISYAEALAKDTGMELTDELRTDGQKISKFIDQARKILDHKLAANKRELTVNYMNEDELETEFEKTDVYDIVDQADKKAIGLRLGLRQTKWIPRSQIVRLTDSVLTLKNKWAAENVYAAKSKRGGARKAAKKGAKKGTRKRTKKKS
jgi:DNA topoisomerase-1